MLFTALWRAVCLEVAEQAARASVQLHAERIPPAVWAARVLRGVHSPGRGSERILLLIEVARLYHRVYITKRPQHSLHREAFTTSDVGTRTP